MLWSGRSQQVQVAGGVGQAPINREGSSWFLTPLADRLTVGGMTVSYSGAVANASGFGAYNQILLRWRGSVYKLVYKVKQCLKKTRTAKRS